MVHIWLYIGNAITYIFLNVPRNGIRWAWTKGGVEAERLWAKGPSGRRGCGEGCHQRLLVWSLPSWWRAPMQTAAEHIFGKAAQLTRPLHSLWSTAPPSCFCPPGGYWLLPTLRPHAVLRRACEQVSLLACSWIWSGLYSFVFLFFWMFIYVES